MKYVSVEFVKLQRSLSWAVVILLPVIAVASGSMSSVASDGGLDDGWHTLWIRSIGFYGMALLPVGIAILASLTWRTEHRNGNWNALMSTSVPTSTMVLSKAAAVAILSALMQVVLVLTVVGFGKIAFDLPGMLPGRYLVSSVLVIIASVPVAALQSGLSMYFRSFAAPVAVALVATGVSTTALLTDMTAIIAVPYATATYATQLGTSLVEASNTSFDAAGISAGTAGLVTSVSVAATAAIAIVTTWILNRSDTRA